MEIYLHFYYNYDAAVMIVDYFHPKKTQMLFSTVLRGNVEYPIQS